MTEAVTWVSAGTGGVWAAYGSAAPVLRKEGSTWAAPVPGARLIQISVASTLFWGINHIENVFINTNLDGHGYALQITDNNVGHPDNGSQVINSQKPKTSK